MDVNWLHKKVFTIEESYVRLLKKHNDPFADPLPPLLMA